MSDFERQYYENPIFWGGFSLLDEGNKIRIEQTIESVPLNVVKLADIGCGNGIFIAKLMELKPNIITTGIDRSFEALKYVQGDKKIGNIIDLPFDSNSFDCVTCLEVLEHLNVNDFTVALNELSRISGKYIIIGVPFEEKIQNNIGCCPKCHSTFNRDLHLQSFNMEKLENLFSIYKFELIKFTNVVKSREIVGISHFFKLKNVFNNSKLSFKSPICIICGHKNESFKLDFNKDKGVNNGFFQLLGNNIFKFVKELIKTMLPTKETNGYWAICVYEKVEK
jgi:SAM-dependent methyltransferase